MCCFGKLHGCIGEQAGESVATAVEYILIDGNAHSAAELCFEIASGQGYEFEKFSGVEFRRIVLVDVLYNFEYAASRIL